MSLHIKRLWVTRRPSIRGFQRKSMTNMSKKFGTSCALLSSNHTKPFSDIYTRVSGRKERIFFVDDNNVYVFSISISAMADIMKPNYT